MPEHMGLKGLPDTSLALTVLEGEEAFLRALHPGMGDSVKQQGPFSEEERRLARAAASGAKKTLQVYTHAHTHTHIHTFIPTYVTYIHTHIN
jgi:hypothetical protein